MESRDLSTASENLSDEIKQAVAEVELARNRFENAEPEFLDACALELHAAEIRLNSLLGRYRRDEDRVS